MTVSPGSATGSILIFPSAVAAASGAVQAIGGSVRGSTSGLPSWAGVDAVGDPACAQALASACRLIVQAMTASADGVDKLARALSVTATTYSSADSSAVPGTSG